MFDLDAYLERIGLQGTPSPAEVHRAHSTSIPFENLQPHGGSPVSLDPEDLQRKLVAQRRGGYCFEQNLLLREALTAMGTDVEMFLARVRYGAPPGVVRPRGHLVLKYGDGGDEWHADVGFGLGTLLEPLPWGPGEEHEQAGWRYRVVQDDPELVLQTFEDGSWVDVYGFLPHPVAPVDVQTINWWVCTHPNSPFVTGLIVAAQDAEGARVSLSDWGELALTERTPTETEVTPLAREQVPELLAARFALEGFALDADGRVVAAEQVS